MKKLVVFAAAGMLAVSALAQGNAGNIYAPYQPKPLPPATGAHAEGSIQRGVRMGNVLQLINPFAPKEYGSGEEFEVRHNIQQGQHTRARPATAPMAWRLFSFSFW
jgi:hypothetical protein